MKFGILFFENIKSERISRSSKGKIVLGDIKLPVLEKSEEGGSFPLWRYWGFTALLIFVFFAFLFRLFNLQIVEGAHYLSLTNKNRVSKEVLRPERGVIFDRNGDVIARNKPAFKVLIDVETQSSLEGVVRKLAKDIDINYEVVMNRIELSKQQGLDKALIAGALSKEKALLVESKYASTPFVEVTSDSVREDLYPESMSHIIGYVGEISKKELEEYGRPYTYGDRVGKTSLERYYEKYLQGKPGALYYEVDTFGNRIRQIGREDSEGGAALILSVDLSLQNKLYDILRESVDKSSNALGGSIVLQDISNGAILSLVSYPGYNTNLFNEGISKKDYDVLLKDPRKPLFNRSISGQYPPGSVFKIVTSVAALAEGVIDAGRIVDAKGSISVGNYVFKDWKEHGLVDMVRALAVSSDVYFYMLGGGYSPYGIEGLGIERLRIWAKALGYGEKTGVDLGGEESGFLPSPGWKKEVYDEPWYIGDDYISAIGQGFVLVTPLQVNNVTTAVANGGVLYKPFLVSEIKMPDGSLVKTESKTLNKNFISEDILDVVKRGMLGACSEGGTAYPLFSFKPKVACKTGTSEFGVKDANGDYSTHAWLTLFVPYGKPRYSLTVFLDNGGGGSQDAAPVALRVLDVLKDSSFLKSDD